MVETHVTDLTYNQCLALLAPGGLGRLALTEGALPTILPVVYKLTARALLFPAAGAKVTAAARGTIAAFEADSYDEGTGSGWTVTAVGRMLLLDTGDTNPGLPPPHVDPWVDAPGRLVAMLPQRLCGRRVAAGGRLA